MGARYSADALYASVNATDIEETKIILDVRPKLINKILNTRKTVTALGRAAILGDPEMLALLLDRGAQIDMVGESFWTPLMWSCRKGHFPAVRLFVERGADYTIKNAEGMSAFDLAIAYGKYDIAHYFHTEFQLQPRTSEEYTFYRDNHNTPYVDFDEMLEALLNKVEPSEETHFIKERPQEELPDDLVYDARETWGNFGKRMFTWEEPPQVSRSELPQEFHPENRLYGRMLTMIKRSETTAEGHTSLRRTYSDGDKDIQAEGNELAFVRNDGSGVATIHVDRPNFGTGSDMSNRSKIEGDEEEAERISPRKASSNTVGEIDRA